jgi:hypothetical protein
MHGRRRAEHKALKRDPKITEKLAKKALLWYQLQNELLTRRRNLLKGQSGDNGPTNKEEHQETLRLVENALSVNPDPLWLWNFRRELLLNNFLFTWETEAVVTQAALENNPKAYGAWHHRKWALRHQIIMRKTIEQPQPEGKTTATTTTTTTTSSSSSAELLLASELALTVAFLQRDERNFHGWSYRRFVVSLLLHHQTNDHGDDYGSGVWQIFDNDLDDNDIVDAGDGMERRKIVMGAQIGTTGGGSVTEASKQQQHSNRDQQLKSSSLTILEAEWDFTTQKIRDNFSNFSALHYRSQLLPILHGKSIATELTNVVHNAICTEPDDQTAWWYQSFLLQYAATADAASSSSSGGGDGNNRRRLDDQVLDEHIRLLRELQEETDHQSKWVLLGLLRALTFHRNNNETTNITTTTNREERRAILERLVSVDPDRKMRYRQLLRDLDEENEETAAAAATMTN